MIRHRRNERSHARRSPTHVPNGFPSSRAPKPSCPPRSSRNGRRRLPHRPCRTARALPCRTCSHRRRCRRCDGMTLAPTRTSAIPPISKRPPPPLRRQPQPAAASRGSAAARGRADCALPPRTRRRQSRPHRCRCCLMVMAAALALAGITVSAIVRIGRMRARRAIRRKRRAMWDSAKAAKTMRRSSPPIVRTTSEAGLRRAGGVQPHRHAHAPGAAARPTSDREAPQERPCPRTAQPQERARAPQERTRAHRRIGSSRLRKCWPGSPAARRPDRSGSGGYFSSWRCSLRTNSVSPVRRSRLSRSALRIDCTSANASSTLWLTTM